MSKDLVSFVQEIYKTSEYIPLHEPYLDETDKTQLIKTIDSTFVSSVGPLVNELEKKVSEFTGSKYAIAVVNGTAALHLSLDIIGVKEGDEVLTQSLNFIASTNAIHQCNASPVFIDVSKETLGMCPDSLSSFLENGDCLINISIFSTLYGQVLIAWLVLMSIRAVFCMKVGRVLVGPM